MIVAALSEQSVVDNTMNIELVKQWVTVLHPIESVEIQPGYCAMETYLGNRCGEDDNFVQLTHPLHKLVYTRPLDNVHVMVVALYFYRYGEIGLV